MMDSNGSNTTAAAAVLAARKHLALNGATVLVLGGTGPVGQRVAQLVAREGGIVRVGSRSADKAAAVCKAVQASVEGADASAVATETDTDLKKACDGVGAVIAAGAAGVQLLTQTQMQAVGSLKVAIDLNAVPPLGIEGIDPTAKAAAQDGVVCYGAIGVGGTKMKIHKAAVRSLFTANDRTLDIEAIYAIGEDELKRKG
jgi:glutamyl-tRNA reductase